MKYTHIVKSTLVSLLCLSMIAGCGGDDDSPNNNPSPIPTPNPAPTPITPVTGKISLNISGLVKDNNGGLLANITIKLSQANKVIATVVSDANGKIVPTKINFDKNVDVIASSVSSASTDYIAQVKNLGKFASDANAIINLNLVKPNLKTSVVLQNNNTVKYDNSEVSFNGDVFIDEAGKTVTGTIDVSISALNPNKNPDLFPGNPRITLSNGESGYLASVGMVDFNFSQNGKKIQLKAGKTADIKIALAATYDDKGKAININDKIPLWSMDDSGNWKQEGEAIVSSNGLSAIATVSHFSWWNLDYPNPQIPKTVQIYSGVGCDVLYTAPVSLYGTFSMNNGTGPITRTGYEYVTGGSKVIGFPVGYDAALTADSQDQTLEINPAQKFTWANIQAASSIKLCLAPIKPAITLYPDTSEVFVAKGNQYQFSYFIKNTTKNVKWYINDVESSTLGANSPLGSLSNTGLYASNNANIGTYTIKVAIADNLNVFDTIQVKVVDNLQLVNSVKISENNTNVDVFDGLSTQIIQNQNTNTPASSLLYNQENVLTPYLNGVKFPTNSFMITSMSCQGLSEAEDICASLNISKQNNIIRVAKKEFTTFNDFTADDLSTIANQYGNARLLVKGVLVGSNVTFEQSFTLRDLHNFNGEVINWGSPNTSKYSLERFYGVNANAKLGLEQAEVLCVKTNSTTGVRSMCDPVIANKRPKVILRKADKEIDITAPAADYDIDAEYYLAGILKDDIKGVRSSIVARLNCYANSSSISSNIMCQPYYNNNNQNTSGNISGTLGFNDAANNAATIELKMPVSRLS